MVLPPHYFILPHYFIPPHYFILPHCFTWLPHFLAASSFLKIETIITEDHYDTHRILLPHLSRPNLTTPTLLSSRRRSNTGDLTIHVLSYRITTVPHLPHSPKSPALLDRWSYLHSTLIPKETSTSQKGLACTCWQRRLVKAEARQSVEMGARDHY